MLLNVKESVLFDVYVLRKLFLAKLLRSYLVGQSASTPACLYRQV